MINSNPLRCRWLFNALVLISTCGVQPLSATDFFLTIGGGYDRSGNQASLEANVVFFQQLLTDKHRGPRHHDVFFADGDDPTTDLQILAEKPATSARPATELLSALYRRRGEAHLTYRNHQVTEIAGPLEPTLIRAGLEAVAKTAQSGDRLIIYVTAHGSAGPKGDKFNTTIDCWNGRNISAREFTDWLNKLPSEVPVVMVMAQCYCGGFGHTIFEGLDEQKGLAPQLRVGFFAQQHDLPAAGCRPDIEHDEEFSSYFWGALAGRSRNGVPVDGCDIDGNGIISFAEAYAYAVTAGETIDIPLRTSEVLLRTFSRLTADQAKDSPGDSEPKAENLGQSEPEIKGKPTLLTMSGTLETFVDRGRPVSRRIVTQLSKTLGISLQEDVTAVMTAYEDSRRASRSQGRGRSRQGSGRRDLLREVSAKWPELGDERKWAESPLLKTDNQENLLAELKQLPGWKSYDERLQQMQVANQESEQRELRMVKLRKLLNTLESIVLENNLPLFATPQVLERYQRLLSLEESTLSPGERNK
jgi:hypothetical protein